MQMHIGSRCIKMMTNVDKYHFSSNILVHKVWSKKYADGSELVCFAFLFCIISFYIRVDYSTHIL